MDEILLSRICKEAYEKGYQDGKVDGYNLIGDKQIKRKTGKWVATQEWGGRNYSCSCCRFSFMVDTCMRDPMWNYCPNCGAEMKGADDAEVH